MSLFEWFCEGYNPGPTGNFDKKQLEKIQGPNWYISILMGSLCTGYYFIFYSACSNSSDFSSTIFIVSFILILYHLISLFIQPNPNYDNVGWLGGFMDNPFRISDDFNRSLITIKVILIPGYFACRIIYTFALSFKTKHP